MLQDRSAKRLAKFLLSQSQSQRQKEKDKDPEDKDQQQQDKGRRKRGSSSSHSSGSSCSGGLDLSVLGMTLLRAFDPPSSATTSTSSAKAKAQAQALALAQAQGQTLGQGVVEGAVVDYQPDAPAGQSVTPSVVSQVDSRASAPPPGDAVCLTSPCPVWLWPC
jgi:hypothetical protein